MASTSHFGVCEMVKASLRPRPALPFRHPNPPSVPPGLSKAPLASLTRGLWSASVSVTVQLACWRPLLALPGSRSV